MWTGLVFICWKPQDPHMDSLHWYPYISFKNNLKEFNRRAKPFPFADHFFILITFSLDYILISLGENWCWSLLGLKGVILVCNMRTVRALVQWRYYYTQQYFTMLFCWFCPAVLDNFRFIEDILVQCAQIIIVMRSSMQALVFQVSFAMSILRIQNWIQNIAINKPVCCVSLTWELIFLPRFCLLLAETWFIVAVALASALGLLLLLLCIFCICICRRR